MIPAVGYPRPVPVAPLSNYYLAICAAQSYEKEEEEHGHMQGSVRL